MNLVLERNLENLHQFWSSLNAEHEHGIFTHPSWPNKQWQRDFSLHSDGISAQSLAKKTYSTVGEVNEELLNGLKIKSHLVIMSLILDNDDNTPLKKNENNSNIVKLNKNDSAVEWTKACSSAFGYELDATVVQCLLTNENASVLAYMVDGDIAGTAISYQTKDTLGIHQLGTVPDYRKMGVAAALMDYIIDDASQKQTVKQVSLQASQAGLHLYEKMGFVALSQLTSLVIA